MNRVRIVKLSQKGFYHIILVLLLPVIIVVSFAGYRVFINHRNSQTNSSSHTVEWLFNQDDLTWHTEDDNAPECNEQFVFDQTPINLSKVMSILMPGAYRGFNYKPHGGFRLSESTRGEIDVKMPVDATLVGLTRYYEGNPSELQYLLTFETDCGIAFRFDHLYTLSASFQEIAETTPEPKKDDTRVDPNISFMRNKFKAGDVIATKIGLPATKNFGFDFGVYDYRKRNEISKNTEWSKQHNMFQATEWYGVCWIDMLPGTDKNKAKELSLIVVNPARPNIVSDYCSYAPYKTLDFNNGLPTDG